jgi:UDP-3-O-[3-hydroxymyristoyl] glucosamine N-acyltransferase
VRVFSRLLEAGFACPTVVHPAGWVEGSASLAPGSQVFAHAYVGSAAEIGFGVIVNTGAVISHDCRVASYANISPGAILAGGVHVGEGVLIGMGVTVNLNVKVGPGAGLGNSSVIKEDVPAGGVVRAGTVWPLE